MDSADYIAANLPLMAVPGFPHVRLHLAQPDSRLSRLVGASGRPPYWAYVWAGGAVLARYLQDHPFEASGKRVLDLGSGCGLVAIAAAKAGAAEVLASDVDPFAGAALRLNAAANGVTVAIVEGDLLAAAPPIVDIILAGDVFYGPKEAQGMAGFLTRCVCAGIRVLVGDPGRADLPTGKLRKIAEYSVADFGSVAGETSRPSGVYEFIAS